MARIIETRRLTPVTKLFRLDAPLIEQAARPGQFVMLRVREGGERIPITIADYDRAAGTLTIVVQEVGATTKRVSGLAARIYAAWAAGSARRHFSASCASSRLAATGPLPPSARAARIFSSWPTS